MKNQKLDRQDLINDLKSIYLKLNRPLTQDDIFNYSKYQLWQYKKIFGPINKAKEEAGIPIKHKIFSKEEIIKEVNDIVQNKRGKIISDISNIKNTHEKFVIECGKCSYNWSTNLNRLKRKNWCPNCDGKINKITGTIKISEEELRKEIIRLKNIFRRYPTVNEMDIVGRFNPSIYAHRFGSWQKALKALGFEDYDVFFTNDDFRNEIISVEKTLNKFPNYTEMKKFSNISISTYEKRFGSWSKAVVSLGFEYTGIKRNLPDDELKKEILRLKEIIGRYPTSREMSLEGNICCSVYRRKFGGWVKAMHALGFIDYKNQSVYDNQVHVKGIDGNIYKSLFESRIASLLFEMKNKKEIQNYEYEKLICETRRWTCDFFVRNNNKDFWVEADGMLKSRIDPYDEGGNEKINYYKDNNLNYHIISYDQPIDLSFLMN